MGMNDPATLQSPTTTPSNDSGTDTKIGSYGETGIAMTGNNAAAPKDEFLKFLPEEYKDTGWAKNLLNNENPIKETFKQFDNAQKLIGSRGPSIPGENATPEQVKAFHQALGVPDDISKYVISPTDWAEDEKAVGEMITKSRSDEVLTQIKQKAQSEG